MIDLIKRLFLLLIFYRYFWLITAQFRSECLRIHNEYRVKHGAPVLVEDQNLCITAALWAQNLSTRGELAPLQHKPNNEYGENLYKIIGEFISARKMIESWYEEGRKYNYRNPKYSLQTSNFTQLIWKRTKKVCCQLAMRGRTSWGVVEYSLKGNIDGQFATNVCPARH